jgi:hypothetical protein
MQRKGTAKSPNKRKGEKMNENTTKPCPVWEVTVNRVLRQWTSVLIQADSEDDARWAGQQVAYAEFGDDCWEDDGGEDYEVENVCPTEEPPEWRTPDGDDYEAIV